MMEESIWLKRVKVNKYTFRVSNAAFSSWPPFGLNIFISFYNYTSIQIYMMIIQAMGLERKLKAYKVLLPKLAPFYNGQHSVFQSIAFKYTKPEFYQSRSYYRKSQSFMTRLKVK